MRWTRSFVVVGLLALTGCGGDSGTNASPPGVTSLEVTDLTLGAGAEAAPGNLLSVNYTGWLYATGAPDNKGTLFDSSSRQGRPFEFVLGAGQVIRGWDQGLVGMRVGGLRRLVIPPALAYGAQGAPPVIPPNATLVFEVELLDAR